ncbi:MAG: FeoB-associated Cys-rich membrane protein [Clostridiales bacterium]|nr:FeoB-associated Cys-rich membrane protein [Clostridiales bacterium]MCC8104538.1 FeoB-associated Cys-rich membrane protein [Clostridiales bacterium]
MGTIIVGGILVVIVALIIRSMIKDKKAGKSLQCGGDCSHCKGHCE